MLSINATKVWKVTETYRIIKERTSSFETKEEAEKFARESLLKKSTIKINLYKD